MPELAVDTQAVSLRRLLTPGLSALRHHWAPFVAFEAFALLLVLGYFNVPIVHRGCERLSEFKAQWGLLFSMVTMVIAGVFLPEVAKALLSGRRTESFWSELPSTILFFALGGLIIDLQYRLLALIVGNGMDFGTAVQKMLIDQFITTPLYGTPYWIIVYAWRRNRYRIAPTLSVISPGWYLRQVLPMLLPAWFFWIPMTLMIFSLPGPLQFSLFSLAMAAWSLIMVFVASHPTTASNEDGTEPTAG
jgi:hypothetical protein